MNLETKITIYKFTPQLFTLTPLNSYFIVTALKKSFFILQIKNKLLTLQRLRKRVKSN